MQQFIHRFSFMLLVKSVMPWQAKGLNPEPMNKRDGCHPLVGSAFFALLSPGRTAEGISGKRIKPCARP